MSLIIDHWFFYWSSSTNFRCLYYHFRFLILSELFVEALASLKLLADTPQGSGGWSKIIGEIHLLVKLLVIL